MRHLVVGMLVVVALLLCGCERPDVRFPQFVRDRIVVWGITGGIDDLFALNLAGRPDGEQDLTADCPQGGSAHITGTLDLSVATADLTYELDGCSFNQTSTSGRTSASLTLTGTLTHEISISGINGYGTADFQSENLEMVGREVDEPEQADVDQTCPFFATIVLSATSNALVGKLCDRDVGWSDHHASCTW